MASLQWITGDLANTMKSITISVGNCKYPGYLLEVVNPGAVDFTVEVYDVRDSVNYFVGWYTIPAAASKTVDGASEVFSGHSKELPPIFSGGSFNTRLIVYPNADLAADTTLEFGVQGVVA